MDYFCQAPLECSGSAMPRKLRQRPVQARGVQARRGLVVPQPRPRVGAWPRARTRGGRATGANGPGGRAPRLRPRGGPPARAPGGATDCPVGPEPRGRRARTGDTASSHAGQRSPAEPADPRRRDAPRRAASDATACPDRPQAHSAAPGVGGRGAGRGRSRAGAGLRVR